MAYITCKHLDLGYDGKIIAYDLNFELNQGDYLCVLGENGVGKSTLIKTLLHLQSAIQGKIELGDGLKPYEIGYLPQQTMVQKDFPATVREIVLSGTLSKMKWRPFYGKKEKAIALTNLEKLLLMDLKDRCYRTLSGGQQQRVLLARALCATEKVILLDEPITGLDPKVAADLYENIKQLNQSGISVIMVSHDLKVMQYATHILHEERDDSFYGTVDDYFESRQWETFQTVGERWSEYDA